jgi:hypothetical protein
MVERSRMSHGQAPGRSNFFAPVLWIAALIGSYFIIAEWQTLPHLVSSALALMH